MSEVRTQDFDRYGDPRPLAVIEQEMSAKEARTSAIAWAKANPSAEGYIVIAHPNGGGWYFYRISKGRSSTVGAIDCLPLHFAPR